MTLEKMPQAIECLQAQVKELIKEVRASRNGGFENEPPIDGKTLRLRLQISAPTEIRMRKKGLLPFSKIGATYRYDWNNVLKSLENKKGGNHGK